MITFFGDDTYLKFSADDPVPRISILGGILISDSEELKLIEAIKKVVGKYTHPDLPIKYNFKDQAVKESFLEFGKEEEYKKFLATSLEIRKEILAASLDVQYQIIVSCIKSYSEKREVLREKKPEMTKYALENLLFRLGNEAKQRKDRYQIVFDWPNGSDPKPFYRTYYYIYNRHKTIDGSNNYCGPLKNYGFSSSILFTKATHNSCLQFVDIVIGALRDNVEMCLDNRTKCVGRDMVEILISKIRKSDDGKVVGYGIVVSKGNDDMKQVLVRCFDEK